MNNNSVRVWAKSNGTTLKKHNEDLLSQFQKLWKTINGKLDKLTSEKEKELLKLLIELAIIKHDLGKFLPSFQKQLGNKDYALKVEKLFLKAPHSLVSILLELQGEENLNKDHKRILNSTVAYHHYREHFDNLITSAEGGVHDTAKELLNDEEWKNKVIDILNKELPNGKNLKGIDELLAKFLIQGGTLADAVPPPYKMKFFLHRKILPSETEKIWLLTAGFLQRVDHFASFIEDEELWEKDEETPQIEKEPPSAEDIEEEIRRQIEEVKGGKLWQRDLLKQKDLKGKNLILVAPTGSGKTEFAVLWSAGEKLIYTLPLRSAVNQIFERIKEIYGEENSGILHSDADLYLLERFDNIEEEDSSLANAIKTYETTRHLAYPAIISTGDQFFPYALKPPLYERIYVTAATSAFVIDEIQAYDPKAMAIVVKFVEEITSLGGKSLIITATLPKFVREILESKAEEKQKGFKVVDLYEEFKEFFQKFVKHKYQLLKVNENLATEEGLIKKIIEEAKNGKRVLVVVNTISDAENIYKQIKAWYETTPIKVYKFHSELTLKAREELENLLKREFSNPKPEGEKEGKILVATQVVEASLDIDTDVLFTVLAPLDALVQRMGRVARRYSFKVEDFTSKKIEVIDKSKAYEASKKNSFNASKIYNEEQPNVFILVKENEKGNWISDKIYPKEVLGLTCLILAGLKENEDIINKWQEYQQWKKEQEEQVESKKRKKSNKNKSLNGNKVLKEALNHIEELVSYVLASQDRIIDYISEYDKQQKLQKLFELLEKKENSQYLEEFYKTLHILSGGYFSENRAQAQRIFREIYNILVINSENFENFKQALKEFIKKNAKGGRGLYTLFKRKIRAKYCVPISLWKVQNKLKSLHLEIENLLPTELNQEDKKAWKKRLKKWLSGVYLLTDKTDGNTSIEDSEFSDNIL